MPAAGSRDVILHVYDLGPTTASINSIFRAMGTGLFHTGVEVFGDEWGYGFNIEEPDKTGVFSCEPRKCGAHIYRETVRMGETPLSLSEVETLIFELETEWISERYHPLQSNCCHFADELCRRLRVGGVPSWITSLANVGQMLWVAPQAIARSASASGRRGRKDSGSPSRGPSARNPTLSTYTALPRSISRNSLNSCSQECNAERPVVTASSCGRTSRAPPGLNELPRRIGVVVHPQEKSSAIDCAIARNTTPPYSYNTGLSGHMASMSPASRGRMPRQRSISPFEANAQADMTRSSSFYARQPLVRSISRRSVEHDGSSSSHLLRSDSAKTILLGRLHEAAAKTLSANQVLSTEEVTPKATLWQNQRSGSGPSFLGGRLPTRRR